MGSGVGEAEKKAKELVEKMVRWKNPNIQKTKIQKIQKYKNTKIQKYKKMAK